MNLNGKGIVVTGAASGIGAALIRQLAAYDAHIVAVDIDRDKLQATVANITGSATFHLLQADLAQRDGVDDVFTFALETLDQIDVFIANAGFAYYEQTVPADWQRLERIHALNVVSPQYTAAKMQELYPQGSYNVVITASLMAHFAIPGYAVYAGTKAALDRFAEAYRPTLPPDARLTLVYPTATRTNFFNAANKAHAAPVVEPSQAPQDVATAIVQGLVDDRESIYPLGYSRYLLGESPLHKLLRKLTYPDYLKTLREWAANR